MRINNTGHFEFCRWAKKNDRESGSRITDVSPITYFQTQIGGIRSSMLNGEILPACRDCHNMEQHGKISGRQKQLLKTGIDLENFEKTMRCSPWYNSFRESAEQQGATTEMPQDWQIDLGNYCNSACIFCSPFYSSRLATEFVKLGLTRQVPNRAWCNDQTQLEKFVSLLKQTPKLTYLHFIGGETLITPAFRQIIIALSRAKINQNVSIGFTTNLTTWDQEIVDILCEFKEVNLGMSIECVHPLNDYLRYGSDLDQTLNVIDKWLTIGRQKKWLMQLRITPTIFSVWHLHTVYQFALDHGLSVESCNFLDNPDFMRPSVLPSDMRNQSSARLQNFVEHHKDARDFGSTVINTRNPTFVKQQIIEDALSYVDYLANQPDESYRLPDLVRHIRLIEHSRQNSILQYLPEYENLLRSAGY